MKRQTGFSGIIILIIIAAVLGLLVLGSFFLISRKNTSQTNPANNPSSTTEKSRAQFEAESKVGSPDCPELDYTGCDTSGNFMTWNGETAKSTPPPGSSLLEK